MSQTTPELSRRRKARAITLPPAILGGGLMCIAAALLVVVVLLRQAASTTDHTVSLKSFLTDFNAAMERERERSEKREKHLLDQMNALAARPAPADDAEKKRLEQEKKDLQTELEAERKKQKNLAKSQENMEQAVTAAAAQPPPVTGPIGSLQVEVPIAGTGAANGANGNTAAASSENVGGKGGGAGGLGGAAAVAAAAIAMGFTPVAAILIGLGLGGDMFGTDHKDGGKVVTAVVQMFQEGDQIKLEDAVNRIVGERWEDPTEAISKIRKALRHPEMQNRLGKEKAKEMEKLLAVQEKLFVAHGGMIRDLGREATIRLLTDLPPVLLAPAGDSAAMAKFQTLTLPTGGAVQPETWAAAIEGYIQGATTGTALRLMDGEPQPFRVVRNAHIDALMKVLKAPPKVVPPTQTGT